eukprot:m.149999 g.149999  ORF g.149999 m.149999 type:complete len:308 (+) comp38540_c0_seq1:80-1003(+)
MAKIQRLQASSLSKDELKKHFDDNGCVIIESLLPPPVLQSAQKELEMLVEVEAEKLINNGHASPAYKDAPFEKRLLRLYSNNLQASPKLFRSELHREGLYPLFFHEPLLDCVQHLLDTSELRLYPNYTARPKFPHYARHDVLWHQDAGYTQSTAWHAPHELNNDDILQMAKAMVNVWTPLVPATTESGCMQFVVGSHKLGIQPHVDKGEYLEVDKDVLEAALLSSEPVDVELQPGDVVLFQQLLFHRGQANGADYIRWSFDFRYQNAAFPTLRNEPGHMARSVQNPDNVVGSGKAWASLELGGPNPR